jgi:hypothetical protein
VVAVRVANTVASGSRFFFRIWSDLRNAQADAGHIRS